ncbi:hypothetical protein [Vibrio parahaemolyticus]|uniref:hypothetical protein n=1 Tax=Vibrio parahaemolyticus TaxID=670 RepID=UPI003F5CD03C
MPYSVAQLIATYSTFARESELRKRYQKQLTLLVMVCIIIRICVSLLFIYTRHQEKVWKRYANR